MAQIGKVGVKFASQTSAGALVLGLLALGQWVASWFEVSIVVLFRRNFGERFLSITNLMFGLFAVGWFTGLFNYLTNDGQLSVGIEVAYYAVLFAAIYHRFVIYRRNKKGQAWHSQYPGTSFIRIPKVSEETVAKWIEPAVVLIGAYFAKKAHSTPLYMWLGISGISLFIQEQIAYHLQRMEFLNIRDAAIEAKNWAAVMQGKPAEQTQGYTVSKANIAVLGEIKNFSHDDIQAVMEREVA